MALDVVAFARRDRVFLAAVLPPEAERIRPGHVLLLAEDGARFQLPDDQVIGRWPGFLGLSLGASAEPVTRALAELRTAHERTVDWQAVHGQLPEGGTASLEDLALLGALEAREPALTAAMASASSEPWFRRVQNGPGWTVVPRATALERLAAAEAKAAAAQEDERFRAWWPARDRALPPEGMEGALAAVRDYALRGEHPATDRGRGLLSRFDLADADLALEALVAASVLPADVNVAPWRCGLGDPMAEGARAEAHRLADETANPAGREDLTALHTVSVDAADTTEVDDALSVRVLEDGVVEMYVHISDVADAIPVGHALDKAASRRASSLYMPEGAIAMLPADLVAKRLSLDAGRVRAAVTGVFRIAADGSVTARFARSLVNVTRRLTYDDTIDVSTLAATPAEAQALVAAAEALRGARVRAGALVVSMPSLDVDARDGSPHLAIRHQHTPGDLVVAEAAVLYNAEAGKRLAAADAAAMFRVQGAAKPEPRADDPLREVLLRRRFAPTHLKVEPERHHGVGAAAYAQSTSPMRRFADLVNQRQLVAVIEARPLPYGHAALEALAAQLSERERAVRRAADDRSDQWVARAMLPRAGTAIPGMLVRAPRRGMGTVWVDELLRELPLRAPDAWSAPPDGTRAEFRIARVLPLRGRIELEPI